MASTNDTISIQSTVEKQRNRLADAPIDEDDQTAIQRFVDHRRVHGTKSGDYATSTERDELNKLRLCAERADLPLLEWGIDDLNRFIQVLTREAPPKDENGRTWRSKYYEGIEPGTEGYGWGVTTGVDAYTRVLRVFFNWLDNHDEYGDYPWWEQVKTGNVDFDEPSAREFPGEEEIQQIKNAAKKAGEPRDVAIISFYADTAVRRTLGSQLRVKHVDLDGERATFTPNPEGEGQKGVEIKPYPLYDSIQDLRVWLNNYHPDRDNPEAPLWPVKNYDPDDPEHDPAKRDRGAIGSRQVNRIMKKYAKKAGLEGVETNTHAYRHAAIGRWKERGYTLTQVQRRTAWKDQAAAEMWAKYGDPDDDKIDDKIDELEGMESPEAEEDEEPAKPPERRTCGACGTEGITDDHCGSCGAPVSPEAKQRQMEREQMREEVMEQFPDLDSEAERRVAQAVIQELEAEASGE